MSPKAKNAGQTMIHRLNAWAEEDGGSAAQIIKRDGKWTTITAREYADNVFHLALYLESIGFKKEDTVSILSYNRPEWVTLDLAPHLLGGLTAGLYPNASQRDIHYILDHTNSKVLGVQNQAYFEKITAGGGGLPNSVEKILVFEGDASFHPKAVPFREALAEGRRRAEGRRLQELLDRMDPHAGAFLIYTSGTTGNPKGAVISHDNLAYASDVAFKAWPVLSQRGTMFSFLPLCHIAEKIQNLGVGLTGRFASYFATSFDQLSKELPEVNPTVLLCVPRLWEKMMEGVEQKLGAATGTKKKLAEWAFAVGRRYTEAKWAGKFPNPVDAVQYALADKLIFTKIRKALGLNDVVAAASGAAPLGAHVARWFRILGIEIYEDYGMTETTAVICMTLPGKDCAGTVGRPAPGVEFKIADDGELLTRGRHVFKGYYKNDTATKETIDSEGWLHSGDLGEFDDRGYVRIRGRKREIMKTSGGKMVSPVPIEEEIKASPVISQVCMVGDGQKYFTALVTLSESVINELKARTGAVDGLVVKDPKVLADVETVIGSVNKNLGGFEQIKKFKVLSREFSIETGEMTPTMKMKRNVIEKSFEAIIAQMY
ncbi:MAG: long-chain fatty acid--CoA ligase [Bdellovibrionales bacterium]|nr:long-chain fatty acid--CoA ligase [Bdellovibrionales bacterium]